MCTSCMSIWNCQMHHDQYSQLQLTNPCHELTVQSQVQFWYCYCNLLRKMIAVLVQTLLPCQQGSYHILHIGSRREYCRSQMDHATRPRASMSSLFQILVSVVY